MQSCCFTGHRQIPAAHLPPLTVCLDAAIRALYAEGVRSFYAGGAMGFDTLAAERVLLLRERCPDVRLCLLLPCRTQCQGWPAEARARYQAVLRASDSYRYLRQDYSAEAMFHRNAMLVGLADACIAYATNPRSGAGQTLRAAEKKGCFTMNLATRIENFVFDGKEVLS